MLTSHGCTAGASIVSLFRIGLAVAFVCSIGDDAFAGASSATLTDDATGNTHTTTVSSSTSTSTPNCIDFSYCEYEIVTTDGGDFESIEFEIQGDSALNASNCHLDEASGSPPLRRTFAQRNCAARKTIAVTLTFFPSRLSATPSTTVACGPSTRSPR